MLHVISITPFVEIRKIYSNSFRLYLFSLVHTIFDCRMVAMQMRGSGSRFDRKRPSVFDDNEEDLKPGKWKWV